MAIDPEVLELFDDIEAMLPKAIAFDGVVVRSVGTKYANENDIFLSLIHISEPTRPY